nr:MAG TPA: hypothetical protein [Caudoviricetes sp.]
MNYKTKPPLHSWAVVFSCPNSIAQGPPSGAGLLLCPDRLHEAGEGSILPLALGIQYAPRTYRDWPDKKGWRAERSFLCWSG